MTETLTGTYVPSTMDWVRDQVETYERSGGKEANTLLDTGIPVIIVTMRGAKSGDVRKIRPDAGGARRRLRPGCLLRRRPHAPCLVLEPHSPPRRGLHPGRTRAAQSSTDRAIPVLVASPA